MNKILTLLFTYKIRCQIRAEKEYNMIFLIQDAYNLIEEIRKYAVDDLNNVTHLAYGIVRGTYINFHCMLQR